MTPAISLVPLRGLDDPHLLPWMELYELAFPPNERLLISDMLEIARAQAQDGPHTEYLLSALAGGEFAGLVHYETFPQLGLAGLWGLATRPAIRGQGLGAAIYDALWQRLRADGCRGLILEVERPDMTHGEAARQLAVRRIRFYQRLGARLLTGVEYLQTVGPHQPPLPMHVMIHAAAGCSPEEAYGWVRALARDAVLQVGALGLA
jgi:GNAT superfamily N-acetyltransferase